MPVTDSGLKHLRGLIDALPEAVTAKLRAVAFRTSRDVMARAKQLVPVDSGYTKDNIHVVEDVPNKQFQVVPGTDRPRQTISLHISKRSGRKHTQRVSLNMLPEWLERGTRYMVARPFMRPAADAVESQYRREMQQAAEGAIGPLTKA